MRKLIKRTLAVLGIILLGVQLSLWGVEVPNTGTIEGNVTYEIKWSQGTRGTVELAGDFDGGTISFYFLVGPDKTDANDWVLFDNGTFEASGGLQFVTNATLLRLVMVDSTSPSVDYRIKSIRE